MFTETETVTKTTTDNVETAPREIDISDTDAFVKAFLSGDENVVFVL